MRIRDVEEIQSILKTYQSENKEYKVLNAQIGRLLFRLEIEKSRVRATNAGRWLASLKKRESKDGF